MGNYDPLTYKIVAKKKGEKMGNEGIYCYNEKILPSVLFPC